MAKNQVRVRFAPSPTGEMHLGNARTLLFAVLFARHHAGTFILRIEDTDQERLVKGSVEYILKTLEWLGVTPDEGVCFDSKGQVTETGDKGPYIQSQRRAIYQQYADQLLAESKAYRCFATKEELELMRAEQVKAKQPPRYDGRYRDLDPTEAERRAAGEPFVIRFKMPLQGKVTAHDLVYGDITSDYAEQDDHIIIKSDGLPTYHFANVIDDHLMQITHVIRGQEWIASWPRHLATYAAFGWPMPEYTHVPLIFGPDKAKLSKRHGAKTVLAYKEEGYLPEAVINYLVFLGWSPKTTQEFFLWDELVAAFDLKGINKANPIFDPVKLGFVNGVYLRQLPAEQLMSKAEEWLARADWFDRAERDYLVKAIASVQERAKTLAELPGLVEFYFNRPEPDVKLIPFKTQAPTETARLLELAVVGLKEIKEWTLIEIEAQLRSRIEQAACQNGELLWPVRAALTGREASPGAFEVAEVLGQTETILRLDEAVKQLKS
ncbi:MAG: glutamate--tRNA ligase [bacterium]|nr:glutamate--tRNA ligase [bacterium]